MSKIAALGLAAVAAATLATAATASTTNYVVNGSFEDVEGAVQSRNNGSWGTFSSIPGWTDLGGTDFEIQTNPTLGSIDAQDGFRYVELDAHGSGSNAQIGQMVTLGAGTYKLSFYYSPRVNVSPTTTNDIVYSVGTLLSGMITGAPNEDYLHGMWTEVTGLFTVETDGDYLLAFGGAGYEETLGGFIDNVSISAVPLPAGGLLLLGGLGALAFARRRKV